MKKLFFIEQSKGFTLLELIIALVILLFVGVAVLEGYRQSISSASLIREYTTEINMAKQAIEALKQFEGNNNDDTTWNTFIAAINDDNINYPTTVNGIAYTRNISIVTVAGLSPNLICIQVDVTGPRWNRTVSFRNYFFR